MSRGFIPRHAQMAGDLAFAMQFNVETSWHFAFYTSACTDAGTALASFSNRGTRVCHWQSARILWPDTRRLQRPLDDCCILVFPHHAIKHATDGADPRDPPRAGGGGAKSTTTSNHPSFLCLLVYLCLIIIVQQQ